MGRAPCCEKMGLKKGQWTPEEDQILVNYIRQHGHTNWRALPKQAGLLRCGKSCRLRWTNYLRPDIKRGNFSHHEEQTIINLHEMLGNKWSAIAAKLPGRTDNEIKNVWHTHLKKRLPMYPNQPGNNPMTSPTPTPTPTTIITAGPTKKKKKGAPKARATKEGVAPKKRIVKNQKYVVAQNDTNVDNTTTNAASNPRPTPTIVIKNEPFSPQSCTTEVSTVTSASENDNNSKENVSNDPDCAGEIPQINDDFWMQVLSIGDTAMSTEDLPSESTTTTMGDDLWLLDPVFENKSSVHREEMDVFWNNLLSKPIDLPELSDML